MEISPWTVLLAAVITAIMTGAGALPFAFVRHFSKSWLGYFNAIAGGLMLAASHSLIAEGTAVSPGRVLVGMLLGLTTITIINWLIEKEKKVRVAELDGAGARKALLLLGIMTAHSFAEGVGVGVSFSGGDELGFFITTAIALHNIPEGLAISLVLVPLGMQVWKAGAWSIFTSLPQPLMAVPAFLFVNVFEQFLPIGLGLAAGAMIWMVFADLVPDSLERISGTAAGMVLTLAFTTMLAFQLLVLA